MHTERYKPTAQDIDQITEASFVIVEGSSDRTPNRRRTYARWLIEGLEQRRFHIVELHLVVDDLRLFHIYKNQLHPTDRDLFEYRSVQALFEIVKRYSAHKESKWDLSILSEITARRKDLHMIHEGQGLRIFIPLSQEQACRYGRGTKWCVSATRKNTQNQFWPYTSEGPLIFVLLKGRTQKGKKTIEKYCFHPASGGCWNAADLRIDPEPLFDRFPILQKHIHAYDTPPSDYSDNARLTSYVSELANLPEEARTREICFSFVQFDGREFNFVPTIHRDPEMCFAAVSSYGANLPFIDENLCTRKMCVAAVTNDPEALYSVPKRLLHVFTDPSVIASMLQAQIARDEPLTTFDAREWLETFSNIAAFQKMNIDYDAVFKQIDVRYDAAGAMHYVSPKSERPLLSACPPPSGHTAPQQILNPS